MSPPADANNMAFRKETFWEVSLEDPLEKYWERDSMGSSEGPTNLKRVKISMV